MVIVVAIAIEGPIATFKALHENPEQLTHAAAVFLSVGVLRAGWAAFINLNRAAEEVGPEAMVQTKSEDKELK